MGSFRPDIDADSGPIMWVVQVVSLLAFVVVAGSCLVGLVYVVAKGVFG